MGYYYHEKTKSCLDSCPLGTFPLNQICIRCPLDCAKCISDKKCQVCTPPFNLFVGRCVAQCETGYFSELNMGINPPDYKC